MIHLNNIVIVGVGGTGLSAIAGILHDLGYQNIVGINDHESQITQTLSDKGIDIIIGHGNYEVQPDDFVIYSDIQAIYDGPEVQQSLAYQAQETKHYHVPMTYNQFIAELSKHFRTMAVTGTNGKSSTTALAITAGITGSAQCALGVVGAMLPDHDQQNYIIGA
ncbi:MAG: hypothetical protein H6766_05600 [Candidatus Peribacteria bacterium]|nr:MAG: hypothetical protein H6766_05600 [Candidatus Peribacteria bacterium]